MSVDGPPHPGAGRLVFAPIPADSGETGPMRPDWNGSATMNGFRGGARWLCGALSALALVSSVTTAGAQYYDGPRDG